MKKGLFILAEVNYPRIYSPETRADIDSLVDIYAEPQIRESVKANPSLLADMEIMFSGWGGPKIDAEFLEAAPNLELVLYGAGTIKGIVSDAFWERGIQIANAKDAIAVRVSEFSLAQILFSLQGGWFYLVKIKETGGYVRKTPDFPGVAGSTVGLVSLGIVGKRVAELMKPFPVDVIAYDPFVSADAAAALDVQMVSLEEVFQQSDVVSLHAPALPETEGMITGALFRSMKSHATLVNTSRGMVIREDEMIEALSERTDLHAVLDVTHPEPPVDGSPLYTMPNVILTPHIAGGVNNRDIQQQGVLMLEELKRYLNGEPLRWQETQANVSIRA